MMYIYVNDRINIVNSELNSPRISEGDYFFRFDKIESVNLALLIMRGTLIVMATSTITMIMIMNRVLVRIILILCCKMLEIDYSVKGRKFFFFC